MSAANNPKPPRPCTEYNIFFQLERAYILQHLLHTDPALDDAEPFRPTQPSYAGLPPLPSRYASLVLPYDWFLPGKEQRRKRKHRKSHGVIGFHELSNRVSGAWKEAPADVRAYCSQVCAVGMLKYKKLMKEWKKNGGEVEASPRQQARSPTTTKKSARQASRRSARSSRNQAVVPQETASSTSYETTASSSHAAPLEYTMPSEDVACDSLRMLRGGYIDEVPPLPEITIDQQHQTQCDLPYSPQHVPQFHEVPTVSSPSPSEQTEASVELAAMHAVFEQEMVMLGGEELPGLFEPELALSADAVVSAPSASSVVSNDGGDLLGVWRRNGAGSYPAPYPPMTASSFSVQQQMVAEQRSAEQEKKLYVQRMRQLLGQEMVTRTSNGMQGQQADPQSFVACSA